MNAYPTPMNAPAASLAIDEARYLAEQRRLALQRRMLPVLGIVGLLIAWWAVIAGFNIKPFIAPSPLLVMQTIIQKSDLLLQNLGVTALEALFGFILGNLAAILMASVFVHSKILQWIFLPIAVAINAIPVVAKAPILVLIMGNGMAPKITIAAMVCFFPTLINMVRGLEAVNPQIMDLMRILSATRTQIYFKLRLFSALPYLFSALRIAASMCVIGAIIGEWIGSTQGIGAQIIQATYNYDSPLLYAAIVMSAFLSGLFYVVIVLLEKRVVKWSASH
ncbi:ABC nitrate/sulfonate/bicarbonate transporter, inner membrane subunit [Caballeronia udeis]|uniref:ABC nitrate/sulfonate/bicarbonate transporter, inner membrane subunit n=1 Tax=Caballeronia udeis TaxID=1232866 RepID=A0A158FMY9_9BURK|nr:ABC transporter permease [Caballeronia udeis]SAL21013.1 ABC nitrate/sulfonate/bicarbonate transporter, inner membrane subunit [Caballeronia udeis]